jgi:hypothetical protein
MGEYFNKISGLKVITIECLIKKYIQGETINMGSLSLWGDSIGRPGDIIYTLISITKKNSNIIQFNFKDMIVDVFGPIDIAIDENSIVIYLADKLELFDSSVHLVYERKDHNFDVSAVSGFHSFKVDINRPAFVLNAW